MAAEPKDSSDNARASGSLDTDGRIKLGSCEEMITGVDHIVLTETDVMGAAATYERLGFGVTVRSTAQRGATAYVCFDDFHLAISEPAGERRGRASGLPELVFRSNDLDHDVSRMMSAGFAVSEISDDPLDGTDGHLARRTAEVEFVMPFGLVQHYSDRGARDAYVGSSVVHPNSATTVERTYVAVESMARDLPRFEEILGTPAPEPEMGTVIMSLMSVFSLGGMGLAVAEPRGSGPTADALQSNGPGLFQVLVRARSLHDAQRVMEENGAPVPEPGTRLSGESALLVLPAHACGVYVGLAGPSGGATSLRSS
jgi:hypothetical protein